MLFENNDTIIFAGDSVTDAGKTPPYGELQGLGQLLGGGYVHTISDMLTATYPELDLRIMNAGVGGNTSAQLLERWEEDVLSFNPERICVCIGINDVINKYIYPARKDMHVSPEEYEQNLEKILSSAKNAKSIFVMPPYILDYANDPIRRDMEKYAEICRKLAEKYSCTYIDIAKVFDEYCKIKPHCLLAWDRIHPNNMGSYLIARAFLNKIDFDYNHLFKE